jgi:hypothetical protein
MSDRDRIEQEPDRVPVRRLAGIGLAALLVFGIGTLWAASVQRGAVGSVRSDTAPRPAFAGDAEVGMVFQTPFEGSLAATRNEAARQRLESVGWVDRDAGVAHVPIEQAMDIVVRRGRL